MNVRKDSWHYKLAKFHQDSGRVPQDLCSYMRAVGFGMFLATVAFLGGCGMIWGVGHMMLYLPGKVIYSFYDATVVLSREDYGLVFIGMFLWTFIIGCTAYFHLKFNKGWFKSKTDDKKEPSIFMEYIRSKHKKVCVRIDVV